MKEYRELVAQLIEAKCHIEQIQQHLSIEPEFSEAAHRTRLGLDENYLYDRSESKIRDGIADTGDRVMRMFEVFKDALIANNQSLFQLYKLADKLSFFQFAGFNDRDDYDRFIEHNRLSGNYPSLELQDEYRGRSNVSKYQKMLTVFDYVTRNNPPRKLLTQVEMDFIYDDLNPPTP